MAVKGISSGHRAALVAGVIGCVGVNVSMAGMYLMRIGASSSMEDGAVLFGLSLTLIFGSIVSGRTVGVLWAREGPGLLVLLGIVVWLLIGGFSVATTALSISSGANNSIAKEANGSDRAVSVREQIRSAQQTVDSLQEQVDSLPSNYVTKKAEILEKKAAAQQQVMSLNRMLMATANTESAVGKSISGLERQLGVTDLTTKAGIYTAVAIECLQFFLVASLGFLTGGTRRESREDEGKKSSRHLRSVA